MMKHLDRIYVAGHTGFVGKNLLQALKKEGYKEVITKTHKELDLKNQEDVMRFFREHQPQYVFICAAMVGGIGANIKNPFHFLLDNLRIQNNLIEGCMIYPSRTVFLGSSCIYPKDYKQPLKEEYLMEGPLEPTNEGYALAKIAGLKLCEFANKRPGQKFISLMPCNLYGPGDTFSLVRSHVLSALVKKIVDAKIFCKGTVEIWGTGKARREFLYIDDLINCMLWAINNLDKTNTFLNVGTGVDISIIELGEMIKEIVEWDGDFLFNPTKPDGMMLKRLDVTKINELGWRAKTSFRKGVEKTIECYRALQKI